MRERSPCSGYSPRPPPPAPSAYLVTSETSHLLFMCLSALVVIVSLFRRYLELKGEDHLEHTVIHTKEATEETCSSCLQACFEVINSLVLQSQSSGQEPYLCCFCILQAGHTHTSDSVSGQNKSGLDQCPSEKHTLLNTNHIKLLARCWLRESEETPGTDGPRESSSSVQSYSDSESLAPSPQSKYTSRQSCAPGGTLPSSQGSDPLTVAGSRDFPFDTRGKDNVLQGLLCEIWRYVLEIIHTIIRRLLWRMFSCNTNNHSVGLSLKAFTDSWRGTTTMPDRTPSLIMEYGSLEVKRSVKMILKQKHLEGLMWGFRGYNQPVEPLASPPSRPRWLWRPLEDSELELTGTETPFISQKTRDKLEFNVKNKLLRRLWGVPAVVQQSHRAFIPEAPQLSITKLLPIPVLDAQVVTCQPPILTEEQENTLVRCVTQKQVAKTQGYPEIVMESLSSFEMPESMSEKLRQADVTDKAKTPAEGTSAKKKRPERPKDGKRSSVSRQNKPHLKTVLKARKPDTPSSS